MESIAHYQGDEYYKHPECITDCLLKVHRINQHGNGATAEVTAVGFRGIERTDCVLTYGEDDRWHNVYVNWIEYQQVEKTSQLTAYRADKVQRNGKDLRRSLLIKSPCSTSDFI